MNFFFHHLSPSLPLASLFSFKLSFFLAEMLGVIIVKKHTNAFTLQRSALAVWITCFGWVIIFSLRKTITKNKHANTHTYTRIRMYEKSEWEKSGQNSFHYLVFMSVQKQTMNMNEMKQKKWNENVWNRYSIKWPEIVLVFTKNFLIISLGKTTFEYFKWISAKRKNRKLRNGH